MQRCLAFMDGKLRWSSAKSKPMSEFVTRPIRCLGSFFGALLGGLAIALALYILTAPPLMIALTRHNPRTWPGIYQPLAAGFQCDWTRPIFSWYFDSVWKADTESRGE